MRGRRRVPENAYSCRVWNGLMQDFQLLGRDFGESHPQPCDVSRWMGQALDIPYANGIGIVCKHNRDCFGRLPRRLYPRGSWRKDEISRTMAISLPTLRKPCGAITPNSARCPR